MALTGTDRGTGAQSGGGTSYAMSPASTLAGGKVAVVAVVYDNSGSAGADPFSSITDSVGGNTWSLGDAVLQDPGAANAGTTLRLYYSKLVNAITAANTITFNFSATTAVASFAMVEVGSGNGSGVVTFIGASEANGVTGAGGTNQPTVTRGSLTTGMLVLGAMGAEQSAAITPDSDSTDGSWSTHQTNASGSGLGGQRISAQYKVTTGGTSQTYNTTVANSTDWVIALIVFREDVNVAVGSAAATATSSAPGASVAPNGGSAAATGTSSAPAAAPSPNGGSAAATAAGSSPTGSVAPSPGSAAATGTAYAPTPSVAPSPGSASATGTAYQPTVTVSSDVSVAVGHASATASASTPTASVAPNVGSAAAIGAAYQPGVSVSVSVESASATASGYAVTVAPSPSVGAASATASALAPTVWIAPSPGSAAATATAYLPTVVATGTTTPDDTPYRTYHRPDGQKTYALAATSTHRLDGSTEHDLDGTKTYRPDGRRTYRRHP